MSNKLIILGGLSAAAIYALSQNSEADTTQPPPPPTTGTTATQAPSVAVSGMEKVTERSTPQQSWKRPEWAAWYRAQLAVDPQAANASLWSAWDGAANERIRDKFPSVELLALSLINWQPLDGPAVSGFNITAGSTPVYDTWSNWWNNIDHWELNHWVLWFDELDNAYGRQAAISKWLDAWAYADNWASNGVGYAGSSDCNFIDQMMQRGLNVAGAGAMTLCSFTNIPYNLVSAGDSLSSGVKDTADAISNVGPLIVYGGAALLAYYSYKQVQEG